MNAPVRQTRQDIVGPEGYLLSTSRISFTMSGLAEGIFKKGATAFHRHEAYVYSICLSNLLNDDLIVRSIYVFNSYLFQQTEKKEGVC